MREQEQGASSGEDRACALRVEPQASQAEPLVPSADALVVAREDYARVLERDNDPWLAKLVRAGKCDNSQNIAVRLSAVELGLSQAGGVGCVLPEYGDWLPDVWDAYLRDLVGWEYKHNWASLPATFRWHEFHERLAQAIEAQSGQIACELDPQGESAVPTGCAPNSLPASEKSS